MLSVSPGTLAGALAKHEIAKISCIDHVPTVRDTSERVWCILSSPTNFSRFCRVHTQRHGNCQHRQQEHVSDVDPSHPRRRFDFKIRPALPIWLFLQSIACGGQPLVRLTSHEACWSRFPQSGGTNRREQFAIDTGQPLVHAEERVSLIELRREFERIDDVSSNTDEISTPV